MPIILALTEWIVWITSKINKNLFIFDKTEVKQLVFQLQVFMD